MASGSRGRSSRRRGVRRARPRCGRGRLRSARSLVGGRARVSSPVTVAEGTRRWRPARGVVGERGAVGLRHRGGGTGCWWRPEPRSRRAVRGVIAVWVAERPEPRILRGVRVRREAPRRADRATWTDSRLARRAGATRRAARRPRASASREATAQRAGAGASRIHGTSRQRPRRGAKRRFVLEGEGGVGARADRGEVDLAQAAAEAVQQLGGRRASSGRSCGRGRCRGRSRPRAARRTGARARRRCGRRPCGRPCSRPRCGGRARARAPGPRSGPGARRRAHAQREPGDGGGALGVRDGSTPLTGAWTLRWRNGSRGRLGEEAHQRRQLRPPRAPRARSRGWRSSQAARTSAGQSPPRPSTPVEAPSGW